MSPCAVTISTGDPLTSLHSAWSSALRCLHHVLIHSRDISAGSLALVHQFVDPLYYRCHIVTRMGKRCAERNGDLEARYSWNARLLHQHAKPVYRCKKFFPVDVCDYREEFFTAPAADDIEETHAVLKRLRNHPQHLIADIMPMPVVDVLKTVDIDENDAKGPAIPLQFLEPGVQRYFRISSVCQSREWIDVREPLKLRDAFERRRSGRVVGKDLDSACDRAVVVADRGHSNGDGDTMPVFVMKKDFRAPLRAVCHGICDRTSCRAQDIPPLVDMHEDIVRAALPDYFGTRISRDPFSAPIPVGDPPVPVHEVHAIVQVVEEHFIESLVSLHAECLPARSGSAPLCL